MWIIFNDLTVYHVISIKNNISCALWFSLIMSLQIITSSVFSSIFLIYLKNKFKLFLFSFKLFKNVFLKCLLLSLTVSFVYTSFLYYFTSDNNWWDGGGNNFNLPLDSDLINTLYIKTDVKTFITLNPEEIRETTPNYFPNLESLTNQEIKTIYFDILQQRLENVLNLQNNLRILNINEEIEESSTLYITTESVFNSFLKNFLKNFLFGSFFSSLFLLPFINYVNVI